MRIKLILHHPPNSLLPLNYQYLISGWIYRTLQKADAQYARELHDMGLIFEGKKYKMFTFSELRPGWFDIDLKNQALRLTRGPSSLDLSFYITKAVKSFIIGLFQGQQFMLKSGKFEVSFEVSSIEIQNEPTYTETMRFRTKTPICISRLIENNDHPHYMHPQEEGYGTYLFKNLIRKNHAVNTYSFGEEDPFEEINQYQFQLLSEPRSKLFSIKESKVRGFLYDFEITASPDLIEVGYQAGFGEKNASLGMGMVEIKI